MQRMVERPRTRTSLLWGLLIGAGAAIGVSAFGAVQTHCPARHANFAVVEVRERPVIYTPQARVVFVRQLPAY